MQLSKKAVELGLLPKDSLIPQATDRLMIHEQLEQRIPLNQVKQKYGTQWYLDEKGQKYTVPMDGSATKEELELYGLPKAKSS